MVIAAMFNIFYAFYVKNGGLKMINVNHKETICNTSTKTSKSLKELSSKASWVSQSRIGLLQYQWVYLPHALF